MNSEQLAESLVGAFTDRYELCGPFDGNWVELCLAETIRKLANEMFPYQPLPVIPEDVVESYQIRQIPMWENNQRIRDELLKIAETLENSDNV